MKLTLPQAKVMIDQIVKLDKLMAKMQADDNAWKRTLVHEWEKLMNKVTKFYATCSDYEADELAYYYENEKRK